MTSTFQHWYSSLALSVHSAAKSSMLEKMFCNTQELLKDEDEYASEVEREEWLQELTSEKLKEAIEEMQARVDLTDHGGLYKQTTDELLAQTELLKQRLNADLIFWENPAIFQGLLPKVDSAEVNKNREALIPGVLPKSGGSSLQTVVEPIDIDSGRPSSSVSTSFSAAGAVYSQGSFFRTGNDRENFIPIVGVPEQKGDDNSDLASMDLENAVRSESMDEESPADNFYVEIGSATQDDDDIGFNFKSDADLKKVTGFGSLGLRYKITRSRSSNSANLWTFSHHPYHRQHTTQDLFSLSETKVTSISLADIVNFIVRRAKKDWRGQIKFENALHNCSFKNMEKVPVIPLLLVLREIGVHLICMAIERCHTKMREDVCRLHGVLEVDTFDKINLDIYYEVAHYLVQKLFPYDIKTIHSLDSIIHFARGWPSTFSQNEYKISCLTAITLKEPNDHIFVLVISCGNDNIGKVGLSLLDEHGPHAFPINEAANNERNLEAFKIFSSLAENLKEIAMPEYSMPRGDSGTQLSYLIILVKALSIPCPNPGASNPLNTKKTAGKEFILSELKVNTEKPPKITHLTSFFQAIRSNFLSTLDLFCLGHTSDENDLIASNIYKMFFDRTEHFETIMCHLEDKHGSKLQSGAMQKYRRTLLMPMIVLLVVLIVLITLWSHASISKTKPNKVVVYLLLSVSVMIGVYTRMQKLVRRPTLRCPKSIADCLETVAYLMTANLARLLSNLGEALVYSFLGIAYWTDEYSIDWLIFFLIGYSCLTLMTLLHMIRIREMEELLTQFTTSFQMAPPVELDHFFVDEIKGNTKNFLINLLELSEDIICLLELDLSIYQKNGQQFFKHLGRGSLNRDWNSRLFPSDTILMPAQKLEDPVLICDKLAKTIRALRSNDLDKFVEAMKSTETNAYLGRACKELPILNVLTYAEQNNGLSQTVYGSVYGVVLGLSSAIDPLNTISVREETLRDAANILCHCVADKLPPPGDGVLVEALRRAKKNLANLNLQRNSIPGSSCVIGDGSLSGPPIPGTVFTL